MTARVLLLTTELHPAGAERVVFELATRLPACRWRVRVACLRSPGNDDGRVCRDLRAAGVEVVPLRFRSKVDVGGAWRLRHELKTFRPDVVHAHLFHANLAARLLCRRAAVVSTIHVVERRELPARQALERWTAGRDTITACVSQAVGRYALDSLGVDPERLWVVPNGIDLERFAPSPDADLARSRAREELNVPSGVPLVGTVARLSRQKGLDVLIEAFSRLAPRTPAELVVAGQGEEEAALKALAAVRGIEARVHFLGFQADVPRVLAAVDVYCQPSRWEGFGLTVAEALAAGKPVVASEVDSLPEVLGTAGLGVRAEDPGHLAEALERVLTDAGLRQTLARRAREQSARFGVERMIETYERIYTEALIRGGSTF